MSEPVHTSETPATDAPEGPAPAPKRVEEVTPGAEHLGDPGKQALERMKAERDEARKTAKANADAAKRLKEIEDRDLSELQKAQRDREEALTRVKEIEQEAIRNRVALAKQLDSKAASFLKGLTEEELTASAEELIAWRSNLPPTAPRPDPGQGPRPTTPQAEMDAEYLRYFPDEAPRR